MFFVFVTGSATVAAIETTIQLLIHLEHSLQTNINTDMIPHLLYTVSYYVRFLMDVAVAVLCPATVEVRIISGRASPASLQDKGMITQP